jgi:hypothetical protein
MTRLPLTRSSACGRLTALVPPRALSNRRHDSARGDRGFVDFGPNGDEGVADGVGDRGGRGDGAALAHAFHAVFGVRRGGVEMADLDRRHFGGAGQQVVSQGAGERLACFVVGISS